jgi:hypothetical protein
MNQVVLDIAFPQFQPSGIHPEIGINLVIHSPEVSIFRVQNLFYPRLIRTPGLDFNINVFQCCMI